ncbi:hypothetical protein ACHAWF_009802 [Thalassiosira exigua]
MRLFDCHCHVHLGQRGISPLLESAPLPPPSKVLGLGDDDPSSFSSFSYAGAAIMSTHPRDYAVVDSAAVKLRARFGHGVPCYGVHPWFLHEVALSPPSSDVTSGDAECWLAELRRRLTDDPRAVVGEIGLDGARWREVGGDGDEHESVWNRERILSCPMDVQRKAFESQLLLAAELRRPTSIHVVRAWGELFDSLKSVRDQMEQKHSLEEEINSEGAEVEQGRSKRRRNKSKKKRKLLPPKIYFHAFSGKVGIIPSLLAACEKGNVPREDVYFGFPPVCSENFLVANQMIDPSYAVTIFTWFFHHAIARLYPISIRRKHLQ